MYQSGQVDSMELKGDNAQNSVLLRCEKGLLLPLEVGYAKGNDNNPSYRFALYGHCGPRSKNHIHR